MSGSPGAGGVPARQAAAATAGEADPPDGAVFKAGGMIGSSPAATPDGRIVFGTRARRVHCLGPDGAPLWVVHAGGTCDATPCSAPDGTVFVAAHDGVARAIEPDGSQRWAVDLGAPSAVTPALARDGSLLVADDAGIVRALEPFQGLERWRSPLPGLPWGALAVAATGDVYLSADQVVCLDAGGKERWRFEAGEPCVAAPALGAGGEVVVGSWDRRVYCLDAAAGHVRWSAEVDMQVYGGAAIGADGGVYVGTRGGVLHAFDRAGRPRWTAAAGDGIYGTPALSATGQVVFAADDGVVRAVDARTGRETRRHATGRDVRSSVLLLADGRIAVGSWDFHLYILEWGLGGPAAAPWPQYQRDPARTGRAA